MKSHLLFASIKRVSWDFGFQYSEGRVTLGRSHLKSLFSLASCGLLSVMVELHGDRSILSTR